MLKSHILAAAFALALLPAGVMAQPQAQPMPGPQIDPTQQSYVGTIGDLTNAWINERARANRAELEVQRLTAELAKATPAATTTPPK